MPRLQLPLHGAGDLFAATFLAHYLHRRDLPAALGAAFLGRMAAGLESSMTDAARWASTERVVEPDPAWTGVMQDRYSRFLELADRPSSAVSAPR